MAKRFCILVLAMVGLVSLVVPRTLVAQDPNLDPDNLKYSKEVYAKNHLIADVSLRMGPDGWVRYHYDRYAEVRRIIGSDGIAYAQAKGKKWKKSGDWGKTGTVVKEEKATELDTFASVGEVPFEEPVTHDASQGGFVWKFIEQTKSDDLEYFTYERTREHPRPEGVYPRFRFIKYKNDKDGELILSGHTAQVVSGTKVIPVEIKYGLMILLPANTVIETVPAKEKKK